MAERPIKPGPRTFEHFPADSICPACHTNDDGTFMLIAIDGTAEGGVSEATPVHLACAVAAHYNRRLGVLYRPVEAAPGQDLHGTLGERKQRT